MPRQHDQEAITKRCTKRPERPAATAKETKEIASCKSATKRHGMDLNSKTLMDAIKISTRNLFYRLFAPFKAAYNNYRPSCVCFCARIR